MPKIAKVPFKRSYWVLPGRLLAGCYPGSQRPETAYQRLKGLHECGIQHIISLMEEHELDFLGRQFVRYEEHLLELIEETGIDVTVARIPIEDTSIPSREKMRAILDAIDTSLARDRPVYVHCLGGRGRTGTVVGCYLARRGIALGQAALDAIDELRRNDPGADLPSPENEIQCSFVRSWRIGE